MPTTLREILEARGFDFEHDSLEIVSLDCPACGSRNNLCVARGAELGGCVVCAQPMKRPTPIACACGAVHPDASKLAKVGWQELGDGELALLVNCATCNSTICAELLTDAALCIVCRRVVVGDARDPKIVAYPGAADSGVHCAACARRERIAERAA